MVNWQVQALVETLGAIRGHLAHVSEKHERDKAELNQKLEAANDALSKLEHKDQAQKAELRQKGAEIERLNKELADALHRINVTRDRVAEEEVK
jgi:chromosome segregation ATPase